MHVLYLPRWYPHRYDPMHGLFIKRHALSVLKYCNISVLYVHPVEPSPDGKKNNEKINYELTDLNNTKLYTVRIYFKKSNCKLKYIALIINTVRFLLSYLKGFIIINKTVGKPDILHVHVLTRIGIIALVNKFIAGTPYLITEHWSRYLPITNTYKGFVRKFLTRIVVKNASVVMPVTGNLKNAMLSHGLKNKNYLVVPNVVDTDNFKPLLNKIQNKKKKIVHISCFEDRSKNISGILNVIKKLSEKRQDFECHLVGEGIDLEKLKSYAGELNIKDKFVFFTGLLEDDNLINSIDSSDLMLMFSNYENMPVVINESFACGVPVLSSNVGGIPEFINKETGELVERKNEKALLVALENFLDDKKNYDAKKIREFAIKNFSKDEVGKKIFRIYEDVLK